MRGRGCHPELVEGPPRPLFAITRRARLHVVGGFKLGGSRFYRKTFQALHRMLQQIALGDEGAVDTAYQCQTRLLQGIIRVEGTITRYEERLACDKRDLRKRRHGPSARRESRVVKARIETWHYKLDCLRWARRLLLMIGDGLAWLYIDNSSLKMYASREDAGFLTGKAGLRFELRTLKLVKLQCELAILADLTSVLCYGDIIAIDLDGKKGQTIIEVKASTRGRWRDELQLRAYSELMRAASVQEVTLPDGRSISSYLVQSAEEDFHVGIVQSLVQTATEHGFARNFAERGQSYIAFEDPAVLSEKLHNSHTNFVAIYLMGSGFLPPSTPPLCLTVQHFETWFKIVRNEVAVVCLIDLQEMERRSTELDFQIEWLHEDPDFALQARGTSGDITIRIARHRFQRLVTEFLSLDSFLVGVRESLDQLEAELSN